MKKFIYAIILLATLSVTASAADYSCSSCSDCNSRVQSASSGDSVTLTSDISISSGRCIELNNDGVTLDCDNHLIDGQGNHFYWHEGIYITGNNNIVRDCYVEGFLTGIKLHQASSNTISDSEVTNNKDSIILSQGTNNQIENTILDNFILAVMDETHCDNELVNVNKAGQNAIELIHGPETIDNQQFSSLTLCDADDAQVSYAQSGETTIFFTDRAELRHVNAEGVQTAYSTGLVFEDLGSSNSDNGIWLDNSENILIEDSNFTGNLQAGIRITESSDIEIRGSDIRDNAAGFNLSNSVLVDIFDNIIGNTDNLGQLGSSTVAWNSSRDCGQQSITGGCLGGNFWVDFSESCTDDDEDGICDTQYSETGITDNLPLTDYQTSCITTADTDHDGKIGMAELIAYISLWKAGSVEMVDLMNAITFWNAAEGC